MKGQEAHNIVLIDGQATPDYSVGNALNWPDEYLHAGEIDGFIGSNALDYISMDYVEGLLLNPAFDDFERAKRYVMFFRHPGREGYVVIIDDVIEDDANHFYEWLLHPDDRHSISKEGPGQFLFNHTVDLKIRLIEPQDPNYSIGSAPAPGYWNFLRIYSQQQRVRGLFFTILYPLDTGMTMPTITEIRDGTVIGAQIGEDMVLFNKDRGGTISTAGVASDGELVALRISGGNVEKAIVRDGTYLSLDGNSIPFEAPGPRFP